MPARFSIIRHRRGYPALSFLLAILLAGCNADSRYEVLSFFFDGVPDPNAQKVTDTDTIRVVRGTTFYIHQPYLQNDCSSCHQTENIGMIGRAPVPPDRCQSCHKDVAAGMRFVHGPVAAMACGQCHAPHRSTQPHLLLHEPRRLCLSCHSQRDLTRTVAQHYDGTSSCIACHSGHGGDERNLLRPNYIAHGSEIHKTDGTDGIRPPGNSPPTSEQARGP